jgi:hypothetical protein
MTWIKTVPPGPDSPQSQAVAEALRAQSTLYPDEYRPERRGERHLSPIVANDNIVLSHSLIPAALLHAFSTFGALMDTDLPLERRQHEMIAATVSAANRCRY